MNVKAGSQSTTPGVGGNWRVGVAWRTGVRDGVGTVDGDAEGRAASVGIRVADAVSIARGLGVCVVVGVCLMTSAVMVPSRAAWMAVLTGRQFTLMAVGVAAGAQDTSVPAKMDSTARKARCQTCASTPRQSRCNGFARAWQW